MVLKKDGELKPILVIVEKKQIRYLKSHGINKSAFMRQAIKAHEEGKWNYQYIDVPEEDVIADTPDSISEIE